MIEGGRLWITEDMVMQSISEWIEAMSVVFSFKNGVRHCLAAGHMKAIIVLYTAEIELRPVTGGMIRRKSDPETDIGSWDFGSCLL